MYLFVGKRSSRFFRKTSFKQRLLFLAGDLCPLVNLELPQMRENNKLHIKVQHTICSNLHPDILLSLVADTLYTGLDTVIKEVNKLEGLCIHFYWHKTYKR